MAIKKTIEIDVNTSDAVKGVDKLTDSVKDLDKQAEKTSEGVKGIGSAGKAARKGLKAVATGFKAIGTAIKAAGIGLVIAAFVALKDAIAGNERASKFFKVTFEAISIVTQDFINFIIDNTGAVVDFFKNVFENPQKSLKEFAKAFKENIQERFESYLDTLGFLASAVKKVFSGDFAGALEDVKSAGKESIDVLTGVNNSVDKGKELIDKAVDATKKYTKETLKSAKSNVDLAKAAEIAAAKQALLKEQYEVQAEVLRQVRDNELISIEERKKANDELGEVLKKQQAAQLEEARLIEASAQAQFNKSKITENEVALLNAKANVQAVINNIETQNSEQLVNKNALIKEGNELVQSGTEADTQRALNQQKFNTSLEEDALKRLEQQRLDLEAERVIESERLQLKIDSFALGTQARVDAENELKDRLQGIDQQITTNKKANTDAQQNLDDKRVENRKKALDATKNILADSSKLLGESTVAGKAAAVAAATIETYQSAVSSYNSLAGIPVVGPGLGIAAAGVAVASGIANVKNILSVKTPGGGGSGGSVPSGGSTPPPPPAFNLVGSGGGVEQIQDDLGGEQPVKAFVVGSEVTNQQEIDNAQAESASLG